MSSASAISDLDGIINQGNQTLLAAEAMFGRVDLLECLDIDVDWYRGTCGGHELGQLIDSLAELPESSKLAMNKEFVVALEKGDDEGIDAVSNLETTLRNWIDAGKMTPVSAAEQEDSIYTYLETDKLVKLYKETADKIGKPVLHAGLITALQSCASPSRDKYLELVELLSNEDQFDVIIKFTWKVREEIEEFCVYEIIDLVKSLDA